MTSNGKNNSEKRSALGKLISETVLLATAPFLAYVFTYAYQAGYFDAFELPRQFISLNLVDVLSIGGKVLSIFFLILVGINVPLSFLPKRILLHPLFAGRVHQLLFIFLLALPIFMYGIGRMEAIILIVLVVTALFAFLPAAFTRRFKGGYLQRMEALHTEASSDPWEGSGSLVYGLADVVGYKGFLFVLYALVSVNLTYNAGKASGVKQVVFPVVDAFPRAVVLFMTSDRLITAPFDPKSKTIEPAFTFHEIGDKTDLTLRFAEVGPLKMKTRGAIRGQQKGPRPRRPHVDSKPTPTPTPAPTPAPKS